MERNESFEIQELSDIAVHLAWAQLEIFADDVDKIQVLASGDDNSVSDLRIECKNGTLLVEQPQYGFSLNIMESRWLQVCVRMPRNWGKGVRCTTISGILSARKLNGSQISLETVSGDLRVLKLTAEQMALKTVSGDLHGEDLTTDMLNLRSVSGDVNLVELNTKQLKCNSISGGQTYNMSQTFERVEVTAVSGNVMITAPIEEMNASLRSVSGRMHTEGISVVENADAPIVRITGVSADLKLMSIKK